MCELVFRALLLIELSYVLSSSHDTGKTTLIFDVSYILVKRPASYELHDDYYDNTI